MGTSKQNGESRAKNENDRFIREYARNNGISIRVARIMFEDDEQYDVNDDPSQFTDRNFGGWDE